MTISPAAENTYTDNSGSVSSHPVNLPAGISAGDLLLVAFATHGGATVTDPAGWGVLISKVNTDTYRLYAKIASGSEGSTVSVNLAGNGRAVAWSGRYTGIRNGITTSEIAVSSPVNANTATPDPPNLAPGWGTAEIYWLALTFASDGSYTFSSYPTNYSTNQNNLQVGSGTGTALSIAGRLLTASSEDPGVFTTVTSRTRSTYTIAIRPAPNAYSLAADAGAYTWTGTAATARAAKKVAAAAGSYSWSGVAAGTRRGLKASAAAGSYAWTGTAATLRKAARLSAGAGSYAWTGATAALRRALMTSAAAGSYSWTGADATLTKSSGAAKVIAAGVGSYAWTGAAATLRRAGKVVAAAGSYSWTGSAAGTRLSKRLSAGAGSYAWTGAAASLRQARRLAAGAGAYVWTGSAALLIRPGADKTLAANAGSYAWTGATAILARAKRAAAAAGAYAWTGAAAGLVYVPSLFRPSYPADFPQPLLEFAAEVDMGVLRTDRATDQQQRRVHATMPHNFSLTFLMSVQQWGAWSSWVSANGYRWFLLNLPTLYAGLAGSKVSPVLVRFVPPINAQNVGLTSVRITVSAEIAPSMIKLFLAQT